MQAYILFHGPMETQTMRIGNTTENIIENIQKHTGRSDISSGAFPVILNSKLIYNSGPWKWRKQQSDNY